MSTVSGSSAVFDAYSKEDLIALVCQYELQLQANEASAHYPLIHRLTGATCALFRDVVCVEGEERRPAAAGHHDSDAILERLILVQKMCCEKCRRTLDVLRRRHSRILAELDEHRSREKRNPLKFSALMETERATLEERLNERELQMRQLEDQLAGAVSRLENEQRRTKKIVLYLLSERNQLLKQLKSREDKDLASPQENELLRSARDKLLVERREMTSKISQLEEDLTLLRESILYGTKRHSDTMKETIKGGLIVANKGALASEHSIEVMHRGTGMQPSASFSDTSSITLPHYYRSAKSEIVETPPRRQKREVQRKDLLENNDHSFISKLPPSPSRIKNSTVIIDTKRAGLPVTARSSSLQIEKLSGCDLPNPSNTFSTRPGVSKTLHKPAKEPYNLAGRGQSSTSLPSNKLPNNHSRANGVPSVIKKVPFLLGRRKE